MQLMRIKKQPKELRTMHATGSARDPSNKNKNFTDSIKTKSKSRMSAGDEPLVAFATPCRKSYNHNHNQDVIESVPKSNGGGPPTLGQVIPPSPSKCSVYLSHKNDEIESLSENSFRTATRNTVDLGSHNNNNKETNEMNETLHNRVLSPENDETVRSSEIDPLNNTQALPYTTMGKTTMEEDLSDTAISKIYESCCHRLSIIIATVVISGFLFMILSKEEAFVPCGLDYSFSDFEVGRENWPIWADNSNWKISSNDSSLKNTTPKINYRLSDLSKKYSNNLPKFDQTFNLNLTESSMEQGFIIIRYKRKVKNPKLYDNRKEVIVTELHCLPGLHLQFGIKGFYEPPVYYNRMDQTLFRDSMAPIYTRIKKEGENSGSDASNSPKKVYSYNISDARFTFKFWPKDLDARPHEKKLKTAELLCRHSKDNNFEVVLLSNSEYTKYVFASQKLLMSEVRCAPGSYGQLV